MHYLGGQLTTTMKPSTSKGDDQEISSKVVIRQAIESHYLNLRISIQVMVAKSGLVDGEMKIGDTSDEVLHDTIETALRSADKFDITRSAYSWLMGIAVNKLREMRREVQYETKRVQVFNDNETEEDGSGVLRIADDVVDSTAEEQIDTVLYRSTNRSALEDQAQPLGELLALVKEGDCRILTLAIIDGLSGADLASVLGI